MKILHINCNYLSSALHQNMVDKLSSLGVTSSVFVPVHDGGTKIVEPKDYVTVSCCFNKWDRLFFYFKQNKIRKALESNFNPTEFDLIHAYTLYTDGNIAYSMNKKYNIPYVVAVRDTDINAFMKIKPYLIGRGIQIAKNASRVFFLSETYKKILLGKIQDKETRDIIDKKSLIIPNGIDEFWFDNRFIRPADDKRFDQKNINLICVSQIIKRKNIPLVQEAVRILKAQGWNAKLTLIGNGQNEDYVNQIKSDANTTYMKAKPKEELINDYRSNDIFVMASHTESFGLVYAEAMSQGLPVIYTKGQGFDQQFEEGAVGYHVDDNSAQEVADAIISIINKYDSISTKASELVSKFDWNDLCVKYQKIYDELKECEK